MDMIDKHLQYSPEIDALDEQGFPPLTVAMSDGLRFSSEQPEAIPELRATITKLFQAGASLEPESCWNDESCALVAHYPMPAGKAFLAILQRHGMCSDWVAMLTCAEKSANSYL